MTTEEKLSVYLELINCNYDLFLWEYDKDLQFVSTNWTKGIFSGDFLSYTGLTDLVRQHLSSGKRTPVILEIDANVLWIGGFYYEKSSLNTCYFIGPIYSGRESQIAIRKHLAAYDLSVELRSMIFKTFEQIPVVPTNIISQYAVMLHHCLNNEKISTSAVELQSTVPVSHTNTHVTDSTGHVGIWYYEQQLCKMFADGDPRYKEALEKSFSLSSGVKMNTNDSLRLHKNNSLVLLTLCSRACINGGLVPSIAYDLNDYYAERLEGCSSLSEVNKITQEMMEDYVSRVRQSHEQSHISSQIQESCEYIKTHIQDSLSIKNLAERTGYSEYYFSHKFKKEVGVSVNDYILREKIEQAKMLLSGTSDSIQSISDKLSFGNRSYFYSCFQKLEGMSPSEYRARRTKQ